MRDRIASTTTILVLVSMAGSTACSDATGPGATVQVHVLHAATGAGSFTLRLDGDVLASSMAPGDVITRSLGSAGHVFRFEGPVTLEAGSPHSSRDGARFLLALADPADPHVRPYTAPDPSTDPPVVTLSVLNLVPGDPRSFRIGSAVSAVIAGDVAFGATRTVGIGDGTYTVSLVDETGAELDVIGNVPIGPAHAFVVVIPDGSGEPGMAVAI